jgi:hypothetical protein
MLHEKQGEKKGFLSGIFGGGKQACKGMEGIIAEGNKMMNEPMEPRVMDAVIIACAQKVEHYEICGYGTVRTYARELKLNKIVPILEETLNEEYAADEMLTLLAESGLNQEAESRSKEPQRASNEARTGTEKSRVKNEREMEPVSDKGRSSGNSSKSTPATRSKGGSPATTESPRSSKGRSTSTRQKSERSGSSNTKSSKSSSGRGSQKSGGRGR